MTVAELIQELTYYDEDAEVVFEFDDDVEVDTVTESKWGWKEVHIDSELKPTFISEIRGNCRIELGVRE